MRTDIVSAGSQSAPLTSSSTTAAAQARTQPGLNAGGSGGVADSASAKTPPVIDVNPLNKADPTLPADSSDAAAPATEPDAAKLKQSVADLNQYAQPREGSIEFSLDETSGKTLLRVIDKETNTVLLQVPSKQALALSESIGQSTGLLIKDSA